MGHVLYDYEIPDPDQPIPANERGLGPSGRLQPFAPPPISAERVIGRTVEEICPYVGTYGTVDRAFSACDWAQTGWSLRFREQGSGWYRRGVVWRIPFMTTTVALDHGLQIGLQMKVTSSPHS